MGNWYRWQTMFKWTLWTNRCMLSLRVHEGNWRSKHQHKGQNVKYINFTFSGILNLFNTQKVFRSFSLAIRLFSFVKVSAVDMMITVKYVNNGIEFHCKN